MRVGDGIKIDGDTYAIIGIDEDHREYRLFSDGKYFRLSKQNGYHLQREHLVPPGEDHDGNLEYLKKVESRLIAKA